MSKAIEQFDKELQMIQNEEIRAFTQTVLDKAPEYFWTVPSSSTGKYHPKQSLGEGGLIRHTKVMVYIADRLITSEAIEGDKKDIIIAASLLHDICKYGLPGGKYTVYDHDFVGAFFVHAQAKSLGKDSTTWIQPILGAIVNHYGRWTKRNYKCSQPVKRYPADYTDIERIVHQADYISASTGLDANFLEEVSFIG